jgi:hypothetical protein
LRRLVGPILLATAALIPTGDAAAVDTLRAGVGKVDITDDDAGPVDGRLYARALWLQLGEQSLAIVTIDAVAIGGIGPIDDQFLPTVRAQLHGNTGLAPRRLIVNASHCHGVVRADVARRTIQAVEQAKAGLVPVTVGAGTGWEDEVSENRRIEADDGRTFDVRRAYALPPDERMAALGPIDPEIGVLRLDRVDGGTLAVVYNFACHPIMGVPEGANTGDITGFASEVIEENLGEGAVALFLQGCAGDINPLFYKAVDRPHDAEPLGHRLGLSTLRAARAIECRPDDRLVVRHQTLSLPRADHRERIVALREERDRLVDSLRGTNLNLKAFLPLVTKYRLAEDFPSYHGYGYIHERQQGRKHLEQLDAKNRRDLQAYIANIHTMEELTRVKTNLALLEKHQAERTASGSDTVEAEVTAARIGPFTLVTFPGELSVEIGLNLKESSPHDHTIVAGYTNGYLYYTPTVRQLHNPGHAQEDCDCLVAPEWQALFEEKALELLRAL